jgi:hypothetical protein
MAIFKHVNNFDNICLTFYFYNLKKENIEKIVELILTMFQEITSIYFELNKEQKVFFLKLFFIIYETNSVYYKYFVFKESSERIKKGGLRRNTNDNNSLRSSTSTSSLFNMNINNKNANYIDKENYSKITKILMQKIKHKVEEGGQSKNYFERKKIFNNIFSFLGLIQNIPTLNTNYNGDIKKKNKFNFPKINRTNSLLSNHEKLDKHNSSISSNKSNSSGNSAMMILKDYISETQNRKFVIDDKNDENNFNFDYNEKFIEFYKKW